jgi:CDP-glucose 4,6-dehydratase
MFGDFYKNKKVFVTGHTGFKGSWLSAWLLKLGATVTGYALPPAYQESHFDLLGLKSKLRHIEGDLRDLEALTRAMAESKPDIVFHLGAQALVRESYRDPKTTFDTNVGGAVNVCEAVGKVESIRTLVFITSDKCYRNVNWEWGYRETDVLGGRDPYSASKGCAEIVFSAYWASFLSKSGRVNAASTRAGNVIGGGDWAKDRLIPDCIRALRNNQAIEIRNPDATRPWQHVLEPLGAYLHLGQKLAEPNGAEFCKGWNFGPNNSANKTVGEVVNDVIRLWGGGELVVKRDPNAPHEDHWLQLNCDRAYEYLRWKPTWNYSESVPESVRWYRQYQDGHDVPELTNAQIDKYSQDWINAGND